MEEEIVVPEIVTPVAAIYAQLDGNSTVVGVSQLKSLVDLPHMVLLPEYDTSIVGHTYDVETGLFTAPAPVAPEPIRKITKRAFMQRFTQTERIAIRKSTDDIVIDIHEDLKATNTVDLDLIDTVNALAYLVSVAILTAERPAEILVDAVEGEY